MNKRFVSVLVFAIAVAGLGTYLIYRLILSRFTGTAQSGSSAVLVAVRNLEVGTLIRDKDLKKVEWPGAAPPLSSQKKEELIDRGVLATIYAGEPVLQARLAPKGAGAGLAAIIPKGKRAAAVRVNEVVGVAGFVLPGMRVDVLVSATPPGNAAAAGTQTRTILQNIEVLSAGQNLQKDAEGKPVSVQVVNVLVTPEEAETLSLASNDGKIQLILRNPLDTEEVKTPGKALATLFGTAAPAVPKPAPAPLRSVVRPAPPAVVPVPPPQFETVEIIHGTKRAEARFPKAEVER